MRMLSASIGFSYIRQTPDRKFEYIYIAPPQYKELWRRSLALVDENISWLSDGWLGHRPD